MDTTQSILSARGQCPRASQSSHRTAHHIHRQVFIFSLLLFASVAFVVDAVPSNEDFDRPSSSLLENDPNADVVLSRHIRATSRPTKVIVVPISQEGELFTVTPQPPIAGERFLFKEPQPRGLDLSYASGMLSRQPGYIWNGTMIEFEVNVTRIDDPSYQEEQPVVLYLVDRAWDDPIFSNQPEDMWATIPNWIRPETTIYTVRARDAQPPYDATVVYRLESGGDGCFTVDPVTGAVQIACRRQFMTGDTYKLGISAQSPDAAMTMTTPSQVLSVYVGRRSPQFFMSPFVIKLMETTPPGTNFYKIQAVSFQDVALTYDITSMDAVSVGVFDLDRTTGNLRLLRSRRHVTDPQQYRMVVRVTEADTNTEVWTDLIVNLIGENLHAPVFPAVVYVVRDVDESRSTGQLVTEVRASDIDQGKNGELTFRVTDDHFEVTTTDGKTAEIRVARRLDYDYTPLHRYQFELTATDGGQPSLTGTTTVQVWLNNIDDEEPVMEPRRQVVRVKEDAAPRTRIHIIQAFDPDGQSITFSFSDGSNSQNIFNLNPNNGHLTLSTTINPGTNNINLEILISDGSSNSRGVVEVQFVGVNHPPKFPNCGSYFDTKLSESMAPRTLIRRLVATDEDSGQNGQLSFRVVYNKAVEDELFNIGNVTRQGSQTTAELISHIEFDHEDPQRGVFYLSKTQRYKVTVVAEDNGSPRLAATCFFFVEIQDVNDQVPQFDITTYHATIKSNTPRGQRVIRVFAVDDDEGVNGRVRYELRQQGASCLGCFAIDPLTGWITRTNAGSLASVTEVTLVVRAQDGGQPPRTSTDHNVTIKVTNDDNEIPPSWLSLNGVPLDDITTLQRYENATIGSDFLTLRTNKNGLLSVQNGRTPMENAGNDFRRGDFTDMSMFLKTFELDYTQVSDYSIRVRAAPKQATGGNTAYTDARIKVGIIDVNNKVPVFVGLDDNKAYPAAVTEITKRGDDVVKVTAIDDDGINPNNLVQYRFKTDCGPDCRAFNIDQRTGQITAGQTYRPEDKNQYFLTVQAYDGTPSAIGTYDGLPNTVDITVTVRVSGISQNSPYFERGSYSYRLNEGVPFNTTVATISAIQPENNVLQYLIVGGNNERHFGCDSVTGRIYTLAEILYREKPTYTLNFGVFDGIKTNTTQVNIEVQRQNLYPPIFQRTNYDVTNISENDNAITPRNPKQLAMVAATDPDEDPGASITYSLEGEYYKPSVFEMRPNGVVLLKTPLDRDYPDGTDDWLLNVVARDGNAAQDKGYGMLHVKLQDKNDNGPVFDSCCLIGYAPENSNAGTSVLQLKASDPDSGQGGNVQFRKVEMPKDSQGRELFTVSNTGRVTTTLSGSLDRETRDSYVAVVQAYDSGNPQFVTNQTIEIQVRDVNDNWPIFAPDRYTINMPEELPKGASVGAVYATDADIAENGRLTYSIIRGTDAMNYFEMDSLYNAQSGVIRIKQTIDYETVPIRSIVFSVAVQDSMASHTDTATVTVSVLDVNDNAPVFTVRAKTVNITENLQNATVTSFTATDPDSSSNNNFVYAIDYENSDKDKKFIIDPQNGRISLVEPLDRETTPRYVINVLAVDTGEPPMTGTATLTVNVIDQNDNAPDISGMNPEFPTVGADTKQGDEVVRFSAEDADNGGMPFKFSYPCNEPQCQAFTLQEVPGPGNTKTGIIRAAKTGYSRENDGYDYYDLPIQLEDSGGQKRQRTIRVYVDSPNANKHSAASSSILAFNYKGELADTVLGRVYCEDKDDWDLADKTFTLQGTKNAYFEVSKENGDILMKRGTPRGDYELKSSVYDKKWATTVTCTVNVRVIYVYDDAVMSSGSLRLAGGTAKDFVSRTTDVATGTLQDGPYEKLQKRLAVLLKTEQRFVEIFSVKDVEPPKESGDAMIDVYYAAHGSPYYRSARLNGLAWANKGSIKSDLGWTVVMAPVNLCMDDLCFGAGCSNILEPSSLPSIVNTNHSSLVGMKVDTVPSCVCADREYKAEMPKCGMLSCRNNGTCTETPNHYTCECEEGMDGPNCEQTKLSFSGKGWALFDPISACDNLTITLEFMTTQENGLLLYNGPMYTPGDRDAKDYVSIEMAAGYPRVRIHVGNKDPVVLEVQGIDQSNNKVMGKLNDGKWHSVQVYKTDLEFHMIVDYCKDAKVVETIDSSVEDRRPCESIKVSSGINTLLNVMTPLMLGGRMNPGEYPPVLKTLQGFDGCIKNLRVNGLLYDLHIGEVGEGLNIEDGCSREGCSGCPTGSSCVGSMGNTPPLCSCPPGWRGPQCDQEVTVRDIKGEKSYVEWQLKQPFNASQNFQTNELQLMFRTRQPDGVIFIADSFSTLERIILQVSDDHLQLRYDLGSGDTILALPHVNVSDGLWHTAYVRRYGNQVILQLDNGDGAYYTEAWPVNAHRWLALASDRLFGGAEVSYNFWSREADVKWPLSKSCIKDVRYNNMWFPMDAAESAESEAANFVREVETDTSCESAACAGVTCPFGFCEDIWRQHVCMCPYSYTPVNAACVPLVDCSIPRCVHGDCVMVPPAGATSPLKWRCNCWDEWGGNHCNMTGPIVEPVSAGVNTGWITAVVVCIIALLIIVLLVVCFMRRRNKDYLLDDPEEDIRETCRHYDEEGAGEEDTHGYDLSRLPKPVVGHNGPYQPPDPDTPFRRLDEPPIAEPEVMRPQRNRPPFPMPSDYPNVGDFIDDRLKDSDDDPNAPPYDSVREYEYEGGGSTAGSLSSLQSSSSGDQDFDYLNDLGPPFRRLADLYGGGEED